MTNRIDEIRVTIKAGDWLYQNDILDLLAEVDRLTKERDELIRDGGHLSAWQCIHHDGKTGLVNTEHGHQICAKDERVATLTAERDKMREALRKLMRGYVGLLETGRDRIVALGGSCDAVDVMEKSDPSLEAARQAIGDSHE